MMATWMCQHSCHQQQRGDWESAKQLGMWEAAVIASHDPLINAIVPVDASDPIEAAVACDVCRHNHTIVFSDEPKKYLPPTDWHPQADGEGEG